MILGIKFLKKKNNINNNYLDYENRKEIEE